MSRLFHRVVAAGFFLAAAMSADAAELVVVDAGGGGFKPGQVVSSERSLGLAAGQTVTLMAASGRVVKVVGPADTLPAESGTPGDDKTVLASLTTLVKARQADTGTLGTFRTAGAALPEPWLVDVGGSGERCLLDGEPLVLWRADGASAARVTVGLPERHWQARAEWPAGSQRLFGPETVVPGEGETLSVAFESHRADLLVHRVPAAVQGEAMRLAWLIERNCLAQAAALVRQLE
ncbi:MAG: hypothetical protein HY985_19495 [Magnetospirillum sp.]|nr:hypothetical protein [Magnetospirillum sp.]